ncbi:20S proteasome subunit beta 4 [Pancytospora philotis]|nr:20S proteasome subunit beta 4 [Pancytospora philotis]
MGISIGLKTKTHVFVCSETTFGESIIKVKEDENRTQSIGSVLLNVTGKIADGLRLESYVRETALLFAHEYRVDLDPALLCDLARERIHGALRSGPLECAAIIGGVPARAGPEESRRTELYAVDGHGAVHADNFVVTGYGLYFLYGLYDAYYAEDMGAAEARHFLMLCLKTLKERLIVDTNKWSLDVVDAGGERTSESIDI